MKAFVNANSDFNKDKKSIETNQNLSTVLELIGNDIKQAGENINDNKFPTVEFRIADGTESPALKSGSSKMIIRRALSEPLTLCQAIAANTDPATTLSLVVADNTPATVTTSANCNVGTLSSRLFAARPNQLYELTATTDPVPTPALSPVLPSALRKVRDYRCKLDDLNPATAYNSAAAATTDFCGSSALETIKVAVSNQSGQILIFNQTNETVDAGNTATAKKYGVTLNTTGLDTNTTANNTKNKVVEYKTGSPIYVIEERVYTLKADGSFQLSIDGAAPQTLIKKIDNFRISSKIYTNPKDRIIEFSPSSNACSNATPFADQPTSPEVNNPKYICQFNYFTGTGTTDNDNWKTLAGIKVEIKANSDNSGASTQDLNKLSAAAEFFPRNVLSR